MTLPYTAGDEPPPYGMKKWSGMILPFKDERMDGFAFLENGKDEKAWGNLMDFLLNSRTVYNFFF